MKHSKEIKRVKQEIDRLDAQCNERFKRTHCPTSCGLCELYKKKKKLLKKLEMMENGIFDDDEIS